jgi:hypothetical protein
MKGIIIYKTHHGFTICESERVESYCFEGALFSSAHIRNYTDIEVYLQFQRKFGR